MTEQKRQRMSCLVALNEVYLLNHGMLLGLVLLGLSKGG